MSLAKRALQYMGVRAKNPPNVQLALINPSSQDDFVKGDIWLNTVLDTAFMWSGDTWIALGSGTTGAIVTLTGGTGGALSPTAGNMNILGTANQITSTGSGSTITFSLPAAITAPGSLTTTTTLAATTTVTAGTGITATTGNIVASAGNISATLGSITAGTTLTATLGDITATNGNLVLSTAGKKIVIATGANASVGTSAAMTAGAVTVATTASSATAKIFYSRATTGGTPGNVSITAQDGTGFTLTSTSNTETSTFNWWIINA